MPEVEMLEHPRPRSQTWLPEQVVQFFASKGKRLSWQACSEENIARLFGEGLRVVRLADLEEIEGGAEIAALLKSHKMIDDNGYVRSSDCALMEQSQEQWRYERRFEEARKRNIESGTGHVGKLRQTLKDLVGKVGGSSMAEDLIDLNKTRMPDVEDVINP